MSGGGTEGYRWTPPSTMAEAQQRLRSVTIDVLNCEMHLGDRRRQENPNYWTWRQKAKAARIYSLMEQRNLQDWILERRRQLSAKELDIWDHRDPRALLQRTVIEGRKALKGDENRLQEMLVAIDLFLTHDA